MQSRLEHVLGYVIAKKGVFFMAQFRRPPKIAIKPKRSDEADILLFENAELRQTAAELLLQTTILREALQSGQMKTKVMHGFDPGSLSHQ